LSPEGKQLYRLPGHWQKGVVMKNVMTPAEADRLQYLEEKHARRGLTDEEEVEMMELLVSAGVHEHAGLDPVTGEQRYRPTREDA
jgi:hypothetical protein